MKRILTLFVLTLALIPVSGSIGNSQTQTRSAGSQTQRRVRVAGVTSPSMPVSIGTTTATVTDDQTVLQYAVNNRTGGQLAALELLAFILNKDGRIKGGEGWTVREDVAQESPKSFTRTMRTKLTSGDCLVLTVWRARGEAGTFEVNQTELNKLRRACTASE
jgi:hypothetical protein